jgi:hypothetical protein
MLDNHKKLLETQRKIRGQQSQEREREICASEKSSCTWLLQQETYT